LPGLRRRSRLLGNEAHLLQIRSAIVSEAGRLCNGLSEIFKHAGNFHLTSLIQSANDLLNAAEDASQIDDCWPSACTHAYRTSSWHCGRRDSGLPLQHFNLESRVGVKPLGFLVVLLNDRRL